MEKNFSLFLLACHGIILLLANGASSEAVAEVDGSRVEGIDTHFGKHQIKEFLGMPYAKPPVGDLRFKPTVPLDKFPENFKATALAPACHQNTAMSFPWYFEETKKSEDCLYLNVWAPADASPQNLKPVLFWIHSGAFRLGSSSVSFYSGVALAAIGDVIVVTSNYRLGAFGFLYGGSDAAPGNAGLYDILEALKWVNKHIGSFGGDASQITVAGQSSAAVVVGYLTIIEQSKGLFSRIIMQSGSPMHFQTEYKQHNIDLGNQLANKVGCAKDKQTSLDSSVIECLKGVPAEELANAEFEMLPNSTASFFPISGDELMPENPRKAINNGHFDCRPLLIGTNRDEGTIILPMLQPDTFGPYGEKNVPVSSDIVKSILKILFNVLPDLKKYLASLPALPDLQSAVTPAIPDNPLLNNLQAPQSAVTVPVPDSTLTSGLPDVQNLLTNNILGSATNDNPNCMRHKLHNTVGDIVLVCPSMYYAEKCAEQGKDVYYYFFIHRSNNSPFASWMGAAHFSEVQYLFGVPFRKQSSYTAEERQLSKQIITYWTDFVKFGKPSPSWPKYTKENNIYTVLGGGNTTKELGKGPHQGTCGAFQTVYTLL